ncbi:SGNH/GDSL hydrolase family protein [Actinoplanes sp. TFC3]|uniref:SGNH/GDSL hydrolase family protein n=1 Tax=Actinoplanes sp. TFC3 TaxID=1710355 RepID=UPI000836D216|nr:SGNH/GDSL hydrolase family protein [Actinoplanes sp. TFC3]
MRLAILGDSHAAGLGVHGRSYAVRLAEQLGAEVLQLARTTQTVDEIGEDELQQLRAFAPTLVLVSFGAAEAFVHPSRMLQRILDRCAPKSWRGVAGLEPRPYFSRTTTRRLRQKLTSATKVVLKRSIIKVTGGFQRLPAGPYEDHLRALLDSLEPAVPKILIGLWAVDEHAFPRSNPGLVANDEVLRKLAAERADCVYVPTRDAVTRWDDYLADRAHLNDRGHDRIAGLLSDAVLVEVP